MFNKTNTITTNKTQEDTVNTGVFNKFVSPVSSEDRPKKDSVKSFLITVLILVVLLAVAAFLYAALLKKQVENKKQILNSLDTTPQLTQLETNLSEMRNLSQRLKLVNTVYDGKIYVTSMLFPIIESLTESSADSYIYFNNFSFRKSGKGGLSSVSLSGVATGYPALYRQMNNFRNDSHIQNLKMGNMTLDEFGNVIFSLSFDIDIFTPAYIDYMNDVLAAYNTEDITSGPLFQKNTTNLNPSASGQPTSTIITSISTTTSSSTETNTQQVSTTSNINN